MTLGKLKSIKAERPLSTLIIRHLSAQAGSIAGTSHHYKEFVTPADRQQQVGNGMFAIPEPVNEFR